LVSALVGHAERWWGVGGGGGGVERG